MNAIDPIDATVRPFIGTRVIGNNLCLIQQQRGEAWLFGGISHKIWRRLNEGAGVDRIINEIQTETQSPREKVQASVSGLLERLWQRQIVELHGREHAGAAERAAMLKEKPHNSDGRLWAACFEKHVLFRTWLDLLVPCNLRCQHCYLDFTRTEVLPFDEVCSYLDQLARHGCPEVVLTGGEIFLRRDLEDIIAYAEEKGFLLELFTNGNFIDEKTADWLGRRLIQCVQISVYGTTAEVHESVTRKPGTFNKSIHAARRLVERGIRVRLVNVVQKCNYEDAFRFPDFARSIGAEYDVDSTLMPNRNGSNEPLGHGISVWQMAELHKAGITRPPNPAAICTAARGKGRITAYGDVYPCNVINNASLGSLKEHSFEEIWNSPRRVELHNRIANYRLNRCGACSNSSECAPCAATRGFNHDENMEIPVSEACMITAASLLARGNRPGAESPAGKAAARAGNAAELMRQEPEQISPGR